jgi:hypothetical protein
MHQIYLSTLMHNTTIPTKRLKKLINNIDHFLKNIANSPYRVNHIMCNPTTCTKVGLNIYIFKYQPFFQKKTFQCITYT